MKKNNLNIILEDQKNDFFYQKNKPSINISFNRVSFIFFIFFIISVIYSVHLTHLASRNDTKLTKSNSQNLNHKLSRADIVDRHGKYLVKTVNSIDIGISSKKIINKDKLILNLKYIFPNKDYDLIKKKWKKRIFSILKKKYHKKITKK